MANGVLRGINGPADVKALDARDLPALCGEIRQTLITYGTLHGGHIGSNLALVEATVALHRVFDSPHDRIVFDVSHQSYVHKMLTGRARAFTDPEMFGSVTGFSNPRESPHDWFVTGHTGTSISLACGLAKARDLGADDGGGNVIALIGDGALSSAVAFEGLNNAAEQGGNLIIIVNDNEMSIAANVGGMYGNLAALRQSEGRCPTNIFRSFGMDYRYVGRGNDVDALVEAFSSVKGIDHPVVVHIHTVKGLGLPHGRMDPDDGGARADADAGRPRSLGQLPEAGRCEANHWIDPVSKAGSPQGSRKHYGSLAMDYLSARMESIPGLVVISPATPGSNGITPEFRSRAGVHYVDTGITEEHAAAFASGIAKAGGTPVLATSATFFQRAFDQLQQEVALNATPVTILVFAGGISSTDNTHSGAGDIAMFGNIAGMTCLAPICEREFIDMLAWATGTRDHGAVAIRVPGDAILTAERSRPYPLFASGGGSSQGGPETTRSGSRFDPRSCDERCPFTSYRVTRSGSDVAILGLSDTYPLAENIMRALEESDPPIHATLVDVRQFSQVDDTTLETLRLHHRLVVTMENGQREGGWGEKITAYYANHLPPAATDEPTAEKAVIAAAIAGPGTEDDRLRKAHDVQCPRVLNFGAAKEFTDRVPLPELEERYGLTCPNIVRSIRQALAALGGADPKTA